MGLCRTKNENEKFRVVGRRERNFRRNGTVPRLVVEDESGEGRTRFGRLRGLMGTGTDREQLGGAGVERDGEEETHTRSLVESPEIIVHILFSFANG